jgi:hypothetical protein
MSIFMGSSVPAPIRDRLDVGQARRDSRARAALIRVKAMRVANAYSPATRARAPPRPQEIRCPNTPLPPPHNASRP